jgi:oxalate decarboxylase/phosphoglucose isomerase-like protein (cupin superfamily)
MWETFTPPGGGPEPHFHTRETEMFRVVVGTYLFRCGTDAFVATPGTVVILPPLVRHTWRNIGDEPGQMFAVVTPGGCEGLFIEIEKSGADSPETIAAIEARFGIFNDHTAALGLDPTPVVEKAP